VSGIGGADNQVKAMAIPGDMPQPHGHGSKGHISLENGVIFQKVIGVAAVAAGLQKRVWWGVMDWALASQPER